MPRRATLRIWLEIALSYGVAVRDERLYQDAYLYWYGNSELDYLLYFEVVELHF